MSIGKRIRQFRELKGWSQDDLAIKIDVTQSAISYIESDKSIPNSILLNKISKELGVTMNDLFEESFVNYNQIEKIDGGINFVKGTINMQSPELLDNILKNQEQITELIRSQNKLIEILLNKK